MIQKKLAVQVNPDVIEALKETNRDGLSFIAAALKADVTEDLSRIITDLRGLLPWGSRDLNFIYRCVIMGIQGQLHLQVRYHGDPGTTSPAGASQ